MGEHVAIEGIERGVVDVGNQHTRSEEHTSELQSPCNLVCRLLLEKKKICCCVYCVFSAVTLKASCCCASTAFVGRAVEKDSSPNVATVKLSRRITPGIGFFLQYAQ